MNMKHIWYLLGFVYGYLQFIDCSMMDVARRIVIVSISGGF